MKLIKLEQHEIDKHVHYENDSFVDAIDIHHITVIQTTTQTPKINPIRYVPFSCSHLIFQLGRERERDAMIWSHVKKLYTKLS